MAVIKAHCYESAQQFSAVTLASLSIIYFLSIVTPDEVNDWCDCRFGREHAAKITCFCAQVQLSVHSLSTRRALTFWHLKPFDSLDLWALAHSLTMGFQYSIMWWPVISARAQRSIHAVIFRVWATANIVEPFPFLKAITKGKWLHEVSQTQADTVFEQLEMRTGCTYRC